MQVTHATSAHLLVLVVVVVLHKNAAIFGLKTHWFVKFTLWAYHTVYVLFKLLKLLFEQNPISVKQHAGHTSLTVRQPCSKYALDMFSNIGRFACSAQTDALNANLQALDYN